MGELLNELEQIQMQVLRGEKPDYLADIDGVKEPTDSLLEAVAKDMSTQGGENTAGSPIVPHTSKVARLDIDRKMPEEIKPDLPALPEADPDLQAAGKLQVGAWLELHQEEQKIRCKLAAHIKSVDKMIFVNRAGMKILEKSKLEVAYELKAGKLVLLDDSLLFDRALENVITNLRTIRDKA